MIVAGSVENVTPIQDNVSRCKQHKRRNHRWTPFWRQLALRRKPRTNPVRLTFPKSLRAEGCCPNCIDLRVCQIGSATAGGKQIVSDINMRQSKVVSNLVSGNFSNRLTTA